MSQGVGGAADGTSAAAQDVGVDHRGADVAVAEQLLDRADVVAVFEQVGREGVAQRVAGDALGNAGCRAGAADGALEHGLVQVPAPDLSGRPLRMRPRGGEEPLPRPLEVRERVLAGQSVGNGTPTPRA